MSPWPSYSKEEIEGVVAVLKSGRVNYWTGDECRKFEEEFAGWVGCTYAIALMNGTAALDTALIALEIGTDDEVIVTSRTFVASVSSIVNVGATPVFADVDIDSQNISCESIRKAITRKTKAIIAVHLAGWPCDMDSIMRLAKRHGLSVIEDCAQSHGARYKGRMVGNIGDVAAWSFCQDKIMTTGGEGGMVTTNDRKLWSKMWAYKDHGKSWDAIYEREQPAGYKWLHESFGTNFRMTEIQAVIGRIQLKKMADWKRKRQLNASRLGDACRPYRSLRIPEVPQDVDHAYYKFYVFVENEYLKPGSSRDSLMAEISQRHIPCYSGSCSEVYLEKSFENTPWRPRERLPNAKLLGETSLMFLVHPTLEESEIDEACSVIEQVLKSVTL